MRRLSLLPLSFLAISSIVAASCTPASDARSAARNPLAAKWYDRGLGSFKSGDFDDARDAAKSALQAAPNDTDVKLLNARISLARLDYEDAIKLTEGMETTDAHALRGRAFWYRGDLEQAADELEGMLSDPNVKDEWAREVAGLARRGIGRHPFEIEGGLVGSVEMPPAGPALVVPCELEGEQVLAMIATATGEVVLDSNSRKEPAWVNLRFGEHVEIKDVPAITQDLSGLSRQMGAPIKLLLGVNLLRHAHATFDRRGDQFVVRKNDPVAPPDATRVPLWYVRGGGMMVRAGLIPHSPEKSVLLVDTSSMFPVGLDDALWKKAGVDLATLTAAPGTANVKEGIVPMVKFAGFDLPQIPGVEGAPLSDLKSSVDTDLGGILGAGLLALFRVTFGDDGRFMWLEADPALLTAPDRSGAPQSGSMGPNAGPAGSAAPAAPSPPPAKAPAKVPAKVSPPGTTTPGAKP
jgi:tetratricopeptide repeat protein